MNIQEIKDAVNAGKPVRWVHDLYHVTRDRSGNYLITFKRNREENCIGLTNRAGTKLNGQPKDFYIQEPVE